MRHSRLAEVTNPSGSGRTARNRQDVPAEFSLLGKVGRALRISASPPHVGEIQGVAMGVRLEHKPFVLHVALTAEAAWGRKRRS